MSVIGDLLFWSGNRASLSDVLRHNLSNEVPARVEKISAADLNGKTADELAAMMFDDLKADPIVLRLEEADADVQNVQVTVQDHFHGAVQVPGLRVTKIVPFEGEAGLFKLTPSQFDMNPPRGRVQGNQLLVGMEVRESESESAVQYIDQTLEKVQVYIDRQKGDLEQYNVQLPGAIAPALERRRASLGKASDLAARLKGR